MEDNVAVPPGRKIVNVGDPAGRQNDVAVPPCWQNLCVAGPPVGRDYVAGPSAGRNRVALPPLWKIGQLMVQ